MSVWQKRRRKLRGSAYRKLRPYSSNKLNSIISSRCNSISSSSNSNSNSNSNSSNNSINHIKIQDLTKEIGLKDQSNRWINRNSSSRTQEAIRVEKLMWILRRSDLACEAISPRAQRSPLQESGIRMGIARPIRPILIVQLAPKNKLVVISSSAGGERI